MPEPELSLLFIRALNRGGIRYLVTGSVAAILYGEPRLTHAVDFVVFLNQSNIRQLPELFPPADFYVPSEETIASEILRQQRGHFNLIHLETGFKADFYLTVRDDLNAWAFGRKRSGQFGGETIAPSRVRHASQAGILPRRRIEEAFAGHSFHVGRLGRSNRPAGTRGMDPAAWAGAGVAES